MQGEYAVFILYFISLYVEMVILMGINLNCREEELSATIKDNLKIVTKKNPQNEVEDNEIFLIQ